MTRINETPSRQGPGAGGASAGPEEEGTRRAEIEEEGTRRAGAEPREGLPEHREMAYRRDLGEGDIEGDLDSDESFTGSRPDVSGNPVP